MGIWKENIKQLGAQNARLIIGFILGAIFGAMVL